MLTWLRRLWQTPPIPTSSEAHSMCLQTASATHAPRCHAANLFAARLYEIEVMAWAQGVDEDLPPQPPPWLGLSPQYLQAYLERVVRMRPPLEMRTSFEARVRCESRAKETR